MNDSLLSKYRRAKHYIKFLNQKTESYWTVRGQKRVLQLFHQMALRVPAYGDFLKKNKINPYLIRTVEDLKYIPPIDKNNYLRSYPRPMLCWDGIFNDKQWIISTTSGSTGEPYYFPRSEEQDLQYAFIAELYLRNNFEIQDKKTLYIDGFAMGAWIGGVFTYQAIRYVAKNGNYNLSVITPGINKKEILNAVRNLSGDFDQVIIGGYPPFIKDTIDDGITQGMHWKDYDVKFIFSAEGFSEDFRDYILSKTGIREKYLSTLNHYGTVDMGTMAHETPYTILLRRLLMHKKNINLKLFRNKEYQPTIAQYIPELYYFEQNGDSLYCSARSGIPLLRYDLKDNGGIYTKNEINDLVRSYGIDIEMEISNRNLGKKIWNLPIVYVHERNDFIVKLYGANIYPNSIRKVLNNTSYSGSVTGKFTMMIKNDLLQTQFLEIHIELKKYIIPKKSLESELTNSIVEQLLSENSEYRSNFRESPQRQVPIITLWPYEDKNYFSPGGKQKWVK